jgi:cell division protein FtsQ
LLAILAVAVWSFLRSDVFSLRVVEVRGNRSLSREEVVSASGLVFGENLFRIEKETILRRLEGHPRVKEARLAWRLPDRLVITVREREPLACVVVSNAFWEIDEEGRLLGARSQWPQGLVPLLTGVDPAAAALAPGARLAQPEIENMLLVVRAMPPEARSVIREVHWEDGEILLYTDSGAKVYFGRPEDVEAKVALFWAIYRKKTEDGQITRLASMDLRHPRAPTLRYLSGGEG